MKKDYRLFTSESVTVGHPDKVCDQISDAILDTIIAQDPYARVACEVAVNTGLVLVMGEITTDCYVDIPKVVRKTLAHIGYDNAEFGFDCNSCAVLTSIDEQSPDIAQGVNKSFNYADDGNEDAKTGAGDQGMVFGYACKETPELMPLPIVLSHRLTAALEAARRDRSIPYLRPDGKSQVTVRYEDGKAVGIDAVVVSTQHAPDVDITTIRKDITALIKSVLPADMLSDTTKYYINPTGRFVIGGPQGDSGLTGRKIIVDTYGGYCPHGGGAFSGKDPTKVDRSAAYMARYVCKNLVAAGIAERVQLEISYAIGVAEPISLTVDTFGTSDYSDAQIINIINSVFDLRPHAIIRALDLRHPVYFETARNGHFGNPAFRWEQLDKVDAISAAAGKA